MMQSDLYSVPFFDAGGLIADPFSQVVPEFVPPEFKLSPEFWNYTGGQLAPQSEQSATRYAEDVRRWTAPDIRPGLGYELARAYCPVGCSAWLYSIETHLIGERANYNNDRDPWAWERDTGERLRYFMKLEKPRKLAEAQAVWSSHDGVNLPGVPISDLGTWDDARFSWGCASYPLRIPIPEGNFLRLYQCFPTRSTTPIEIAGRLRYLVQSYRDNDEAKKSAREAW